jgi:rRNA maturation protein Nop10
MERNIIKVSPAETVEKDQEHNYFWTIFNQKCPHCRKGELFKVKNPYRLKTLFDMHDNCPVCGQRTEIEPGFYYGTSYVSYALTVAFSASTFVAWWVLIGISTEDNRIFWWLSINGVFMVLLQPYLMRLSRVMWLSFFVKYDDNWKLQSKEKQECSDQRYLTR